VTLNFLLLLSKDPLWADQQYDDHDNHRRGFSVPELKILIDVVQAAIFITEKKSTELINKVANLGDSHRAERLKGNMVCFNTRKHSNEAKYYNVGFLEEALLQKKKASFYYFDLNENGNNQTVC